MAEQYEGPIMAETPSIPPDAAKQTPEEYVASRIGAIPSEIRGAMGFGANPEMYMHLELMFRQCYWRERHDMLERNTQAMIRHVLAARAAAHSVAQDLMKDCSAEEIKTYLNDLLEEKMELLPEHFDVMPEL